MADIEINFTLQDNSDEVLEAFRQACLRALERCGMQAEGYAADNLTNQEAVDTGNLRNSITHRVDDNSVYIGTNVEYAPYVELGTGKYYPGGRPTPWAYQDDKGNWHWTAGNPARPYIKPAVEDHKQTYRNIIEDELKGL